MRLMWLILAVLYALPAVVSIALFELYAFWVFAAIALAYLISVLAQKKRLLACILSWVIGLGTVSLLTALYLQGEGFNDRFFYHFTLESLMIGFDAYPAMPALAGSYMLACLVTPWFVGKRGKATQKTPIWALSLSALVALFFFPPATSLADYAFEKVSADSGTTKIRREFREVETEPLTQTPKNLILIYAESLEQTWFDETVFPDLMKQLGPLREQAYEFTNTVQVDGTGWTMAGLVASQCSLPFNIQYLDGQEAHAGLAAIEEPFKNEICLGDILDAYGYETVFMGGATLSFAGKGAFLRANGFDQAYGFKELRDDVPEWWDYKSGWGLYDDTLIGLADKKLDDLVAGESPFLLSVLTVDTHQPAGHIPKDCPSYAEENDILQAVHCNDKILGNFISGLLTRDDLDDTLIVLFSDHLALRNTAWDRFTALGDNRRLSWMVWGQDLAPAKNTAKATHFDVTPTLLEMMGIPNYRQNNWGQSVLSGEDGYWFSREEAQREAAERVSYLDMEGQTAKMGVTISSLDKTISIGKKTFKASRAGFDLNDAIFMLLLNKDGEVDAIVFAEDLDQFKRVAKNYTIIAVSLNKAIAPDAEISAKTPSIEAKTDSTEDETTPPSPPLYFYVGTPSKDSAMTGVTTEVSAISRRQMRRLLKGKAPK
jgi:phosphoglycerol transferase